jgi:glycerol-3-phosphate responsive antiterminator
MDKMSDLLEISPIVAAVKDDEGLSYACRSDCNVVFILYGTIVDIGQIVAKVIDSGKVAIVHTDLVSGLSGKEIAIDFISQNTKAQGIISTKPALIKRAKELGLIGIQRSFIIDSIALTNLKKQIRQYEPDAIEILPGIMPRIITEIKNDTSIPLIAGGLLKDKKDIMAALEAGADAISTTSLSLWEA